MRRPLTAPTRRTEILPDATEASTPLAQGAAGPGAGGPLLLDRYRLGRRIGSGGFGVVWRAWDERLEREVAVKVVPREGPPGVRVEREARAAARLNHPGIVALYELAADEDDVYLVSELVHGATVAEVIRAGALSDRDVARLGAALCEALEHAHARGVVHRDVKPHNVMVVAEPAAGAGFAKLTDFGVAYLAGGEPLTRTGDVVGTLAYMAPEQAEGRPVTGACDVYSLALTLYEAWTGSNPVRGRGPAATAKRLGRSLPSLAAGRRELPAELSDVVDDALDPRPERRPSLEELREELTEAEPHLSDEGGLAPARERLGLASAPARVALPGEGALPARVGAGLAAGALAFAGLVLLGPTPPFSPLLAAVLVTMAVAALPRLGWIAAALGVCGWLASPSAGREGTALVLALALAPTPALLPRAGTLWSVPALAPLLGWLAVAPAFVALAGLAGTAWRRAGLACAGFLWLAAGELLTGRDLLFGAPDGALGRGLWEDSPTGALADALYPLATSPALAPVVVWTGFAVVVPVVVRGRFVALDAVAAGLWAAALLLALVGVGDLLAASTALGAPRGGAAGPVVGALAAVAVAAAIAARDGTRAPRPGVTLSPR